MDENTDYNRLLIDYMCPIISDDRLWFLVRLPITSDDNTEGYTVKFD